MKKDPFVYSLILSIVIRKRTFFSKWNLCPTISTSKYSIFSNFNQTLCKHLLNTQNEKSKCYYLLVFFFSLYRDTAVSLSWLFNSRWTTLGTIWNVVSAVGGLWDCSSFAPPEASQTSESLSGSKHFVSMKQSGKEEEKPWSANSPVSPHHLKALSCRQGPWSLIVVQSCAIPLSKFEIIFYVKIECS